MGRWSSKPETRLVVEPMLQLDTHAHQGGVDFNASGTILAIGGGFQVHVNSLATGGALNTLQRAGRVRCVARSVMTNMATGCLAVG